MQTHSHLYNLKIVPTCDDRHRQKKMNRTEYSLKQLSSRCSKIKELQKYWN